MCQQVHHLLTHVLTTGPVALARCLTNFSVDSALANASVQAQQLLQSSSSTAAARLYGRFAFSDLGRRWRSTLDSHFSPAGPAKARSQPAPCACKFQLKLPSVVILLSVPLCECVLLNRRTSHVQSAASGQCCQSCQPAETNTQPTSRYAERTTAETPASNFLSLNPFVA